LGSLNSGGSLAKCSKFQVIAEIVFESRVGNLMANVATPRAAHSGKTVAVIVLVGVFFLLNVFSLVKNLNLEFGLFGDDAFWNFITVLWVLATFCYLGVAALALMRKPRIASVLLIPAVLGDVLILVRYVADGVSPADVFPFVSLKNFSLDYFAGNLLLAFELPALVVIALLLLTKSKAVDLKTSPLIFEGSLMTQASFCPKCGSPAGEGDFCSKCGNSLLGHPASVASLAATSGSTTSTMAVVAFVLSFFVPIVGLILGYVSRGEIDRSQGRLTGRGLATASIVINWISIAVGVIWIIVLVAAGANTTYY
jgi:hypothetical protein